MVRLPFGGSSRRGVDGAELLFSFWSTPSLSMVAVSCCSLLCDMQRRKLRDKKEEDDRASFPTNAVGHCGAVLLVDANRKNSVTQQTTCCL